MYLWKVKNKYIDTAKALAISEWHRLQILNYKRLNRTLGRTRIRRLFKEIAPSEFRHCRHTRIRDQVPLKNSKEQQEQHPQTSPRKPAAGFVATVVQSTISKRTEDGQTERRTDWINRWTELELLLWYSLLGCFGQAAASRSPPLPLHLLHLLHLQPAVTGTERSRGLRKWRPGRNLCRSAPRPPPPGYIPPFRSMLPNSVLSVLGPWPCVPEHPHSWLWATLTRGCRVARKRWFRDEGLG